MDINKISLKSLSFEIARKEFITSCKSRNLSKKTLEYYNGIFNKFEYFIASIDRNIVLSDVSKITKQDMNLFVIDGYKLSATTASHCFRVMRNFFNYLINNDYLEESPLKNMKTPKMNDTVIETFSMDQIQSILSIIDTKTFVGLRDYLIILLLLDTGIRASEFLALTIDDVDLIQQHIVIRKGKGGKFRIVPISENTIKILRKYLNHLPELQHKHLIINCFGQQMTIRRLQLIIKELCNAVGITGVRCSPHTFRHTFAINFLRNGGNLFALQKCLGHSTLDMTKRYSALADSDVQNAHKSASPVGKLDLSKVIGKKKIK